MYAYISDGANLCLKINKYALMGHGQTDNFEGGYIPQGCVHILCMANTSQSGKWHDGEKYKIVKSQLLHLDIDVTLG